MCIASFMRMLYIVTNVRFRSLNTYLSLSIWRACFQNLLHPPPTCYSVALLTSFCNENSLSHKICSYCGLLSFDVLHNIYKVIKSGNEWHAGVDRRGFGTKQDFIRLFFFMYVQQLWQGQKAVLTIVEFEFFDIIYSKFHLVSTFSIWSKFCVENGLFCCDLSCKWVTCRSGCKRFWKSALHMCRQRETYLNE